MGTVVCKSEMSMVRNVPSRNSSWMLLSGKSAIPISASINRFCAVKLSIVMT
jgi:hypothetical protein